MEQSRWPAVTVLRLKDYDREQTEAAVERIFQSWPGAAEFWDSLDAPAAG